MNLLFNRRTTRYNLFFCIKAFLAVSLIILPALSLQGTDYFVKTNGNNGAAGTSWAAAWLTISRAASNARAGDTVTVSNGTYFGDVNVMSNGSTGNLITFRPSNPGQVTVDGTVNGFYLNGRRYVQILGFRIKRASQYGIYIGNNSTNIVLIRNTIYSNTLYGIRINTDACRNYILTNKIAANQDTGIYVSGGDNNFIISNRINNNTSDGIRITGNSTNNMVLKNAVYSNGTYGISLYFGIIRHNYILSNNIWSPAAGLMDQDFGITLGDVVQNYIHCNVIYNHFQYGINISGNARSNHISRNNIYSNNVRGIFIQRTNADYNLICSNRIWGEDNAPGIEIQFGNYNTVSSNWFYNNWAAVYIQDTASNNYVVQNTMVSNLFAGVYINDDTSDNNEILRNNIYGINQRHGILINNSDRNLIRSNFIHNNATNGILLQGHATRNVIARNVIVSNGLNGILIRSNSATGNSILTNHIRGMNQKYGIRIDSGDGNTLSSNSIHHQARYGIFLTNSAFSNSILQNTVYSNDFKGIYFDSDTADLNLVVFNNVFGANQDYGIEISFGDRNTVVSNHVHGNAWYGITLSGDARSNCVGHNTAASNGINGIRVVSSGNAFNRVAANHLFGAQNYGLYLSGGRRNTIESNLIHNNSFYGMSIENTAGSNYVRHNTIYSNSLYGIQIFGNLADNNFILTNTIWGLNQDYAIRLEFADGQTIAGNTLRDNEQIGIRIVESTNTVLAYNRIRGNPVGVDHQDSLSSIYLNTISNNNFGLIHKSGSFQRMEKNNMQSNTVCAFSNNTLFPVRITNTWWGTTLASAIASRIRNNGGYSNFGRYRLRGPFDISPGADTERLPAVTWCTAAAAGNTVNLKWNRPVDTSDFTRYCVYRSILPGTTNLSSALIVWYTNNANGTNYRDTGLCYGTNYYYHITSLDDPDSPNNLTNESWYSPEAAAAITNSYHPGPYYVDDDSGSDSYPGSFTQPFRTIRKAALAMMSGPPACTSATAFIFPGLYHGRTVISSNKNPGSMVFTGLSNTRPLLNGSLLSNTAFKITNASRILIAGLTIIRYTNGIVLRGASASNGVIDSVIYSNEIAGIWLNSDSADNNLILRNHFWGSNQGIGVRINDGDRNTIRSNRFRRNQSYGLYLSGSACSNIIIQNLIYSNYTDGIELTSDMADYNIIQANDVWGACQACGISIVNGDHNTVSQNAAHNNRYRGIYLSGSASTNFIVRNSVYSNDWYGIYISTDTADNNYILSNTLWGHTQDTGIGIFNSDNSRVFRNLFHDLEEYGLYVEGGATNTLVINNTLVKCGSEDALYWSVNSCGTMLNNIILSNGNGAGDYGIENNNTGPLYAAYNLLFGHTGGPTNGGFIAGPGNLFTDPMLQTTTGFTIASGSSPAVDSGIVIPGVSDNFYNDAPDMGWKEYSVPGAPPGPSAVTTDELLFTSLDEAVLAPNPFRWDNGRGFAGITFFRLTPEFELRVFSITGALLYTVQGRSRNGEWTWELGTRNGKKLKSGIYICWITNAAGQKKRIKLVVIE